MLASPRSRLTMMPATRARSSGASSTRVPTSAANTPPRSMSPTRRTGAPASRATCMLTRSASRRLISAGLPAPSITTRSCAARRRARLSATTGSRSAWRARYSRQLTRATARPWTTSCERSSPSGFSKIGFMSTVGSTPAASACAAWARPISPPSTVTAAFSDMFWALNGATRWPARANSRQSAAASRLLPTPDDVPCTITHGAGLIGRSAR